MQGTDPGCCSWTGRLGGCMEDAAVCQPCLPTGHFVTGLTENIRASNALLSHAL